MNWTMLKKKFIRETCTAETDKEKRIKICFTASAGGHFEQILQLKPLMQKFDSFILTEKTPYETYNCDAKTYRLKKTAPSDFLYPFWIAVIAIRSVLIFIKEKPDLVISTGVMATIPICLTAKIFKKKVIYIESFAKVTSPTRTGNFLYRFADKFYVQWEQMLEVYPEATYLGGIY